MKKFITFFFFSKDEIYNSDAAEASIVFYSLDGTVDQSHQYISD